MRQQGRRIEINGTDELKGVIKMQRFKLRKLSAWGNSLGVRLPKDYCAWLHLDDGVQVEIELDKDQQCLIIRKK